MDYMQEIAVCYMRWKTSDTRITQNDTEKRLAAIESKISVDIQDSFGAEGVKVWNQEDERAIQLLTSILYHQPYIAWQIVEELGAAPFPTFLKDIADKLRPLLNNSGNIPGMKKISGLVHNVRNRMQRDAPGGWPGTGDPINYVLLSSPPIAYEAAKVLDCAVPFSVVLQDEIEEIARSRSKRLEPDEAAAESLSSLANSKAESSKHSLARILKNLLNIPRAATGEFDAESLALPRGHSDQAKKIGPTSENGAIEKEPREFPPRTAENCELVGLAFSGGGIRSGTFNLGVLQALADLDLLRKIDYLSAVSGGTYIASWLASWCKRQKDGVRRVQRWLSSWRSPDPNMQEVKPIWFLREYSNYLTPKKGVFSADTWGTVAIWIRNTLLNQIVLLLALSCILLLPRALYRYSSWIGHDISLWIVGPMLLVVSILIGKNLAKFERQPDGELKAKWPPSWFTTQAGVQWTIVVPLLIASYWGCSYLLIVKHAPAENAALIDVVRSCSTLFVVVVFFGCLLLAQVFGRFDRCFSFHVLADNPPKKKAAAFFWIALVNLLTAVVVGGLLSVVRWVFATQLSSDVRSAHVLTWGPSLLLLVLATAIIVQLGLLGINFPDQRREWWSRLAAWLTIYSFGWVVVFGLAFFGPWLVLNLEAKWRAAGGLAWLVSTAFGVMAGRSPKTSALQKENSSFLQTAAKVAPYVFIVGLLVILSFGLHLGVALSNWVTGVDPYCTRFSTLVKFYDDPYALLAALIAFVAAFLLAWRIDINEFSMHHFYRNRLMRCYMGATREQGKRKANPFTGFDRTDDIPLSLLQTEAEPRFTGKNGSETEFQYFGPYLILNTSLNLVAGDELAWQERKAQSFFFTPRWSGFEPISHDRTKQKLNVRSEGYRKTAKYAYPPDGLGTATGVAISGAAANPNMGYHSSPPLAFLMTLFNVRLGWWMGNPRHESSWTTHSPLIGLFYLLSELTGSTNDRSRYVNLSDGGHFENLGVYELVRRRCRYIIACDSEEDPDYHFNGLGNLIRKCRTDFGVEIQLQLDQMRRFDDLNLKAHYLLGDIIYPAPGAIRGQLLFIKSSLMHDEEVDIQEYSWRNKDFPHQTTADQWFDESQFESYRALGHHVAMAALQQAAVDTQKFGEDEDGIRNLFGHLAKPWRKRTAGRA